MGQTGTADHTVSTVSREAGAPAAGGIPRSDGGRDSSPAGRPNPLTTERVVSIITPSLNQGEFLLATLQSVAAQDYPHVEHIVLDGGSTDDSVDLLRTWAANHPLRWSSSPDSGQSSAISRGVEMATGGVVAWLNSDDIYLDSSVISDIMECFEGGALAVTGAGWYISATGQRLRHIPVYTDRLDYRTLRHVDWILQPATFFRRDVFLNYGLDTTLTYAFDWDLFIRMSRHIEFTAIDRDVAGYRLHPSGKTVSGAGRRKRELLAVTRRYNGRFTARYVLLSLLVRLEGFAEGLPPPAYRVTHGLMSRIVHLSHWMTRGRGVQY